MVIDNKKLLIIAIVVLLVGNIFFAAQYFLLSRETQTTQKVLETQKVNGKVINFLKLFIDKVLKADKEISFDQRLMLENSVRDLQDKEILSQWERFIASKTELEAQLEVKNLLDLLVKKIYY